MQLKETKNRLQQIISMYNKTEDNFVIAFCGVFSSGKSSILNYLIMNQVFSLPVGNFPITKVVTRISYGSQLVFYFKIFNEDDIHSVVHTRYIDQNEFEEIVLGKTMLPQGCKELCIEMPHPILRNGVVFVDTPGFLDEMNGKLEQMSRDAVMNCDLAVFCTSAAMLGQQFEKKYIEELQQSIGNFCMVVNRMDCCNTIEDRTDIEKMAMRLMRGNGIEMTKIMGESNVFFTIAAGMYIEMTQLSALIGVIICNDLLMKRIKVSTKQRVGKFQIDSLLKNILEEKEAIQENLDLLGRKYDNELNQETLKIDLQVAEDTRIREGQIYLFTLELEEQIQMTIEKLNQLERDKVVSDFVNQVKQYLLTTYIPIAAKFDKTHNLYGQCEKEFRKILNSFKISEPEKMRVKKREGYQRAIMTLAHISIGNFSVDDGYEFEYINYHLPVIQAVQNNLKPSLEKVFRNTLPTVKRSIENNKEMMVLKNKIKKLQDSLDGWKQLEDSCFQIQQLIIEDVGC